MCIYVNMLQYLYKCRHGCSTAQCWLDLTIYLTKSADWWWYDFIYIHHLNMQTSMCTNLFIYLYSSINETKCRFPKNSMTQCPKQSLFCGLISTTCHSTEYKSATLLLFPMLFLRCSGLWIYKCICEFTTLHWQHPHMYQYVYVYVQHCAPKSQVLRMDHHPHHPPMFLLNNHRSPRLDV